MIFRGSNDVALNVLIIENGAPAPLAGSLITIIIKAGPRRMTKTATISDTGLATTTLTSDDLSSAGMYHVQAIVEYTDGRSFPTEIGAFNVEDIL